MMELHVEHKEELVKAGIFVLGQATGIIGLKVLKSREAKKLMVRTTATALRIKAIIAENSASAQECTDDIIAEAKEYNRQLKETEATSGSETNATSIDTQSCPPATVTAQ